MDPTRFLEAVRAARLEEVRSGLEVDPDLARARVDAPREDGGHEQTTAVHLAVATGEVEVLRLLLDAGASANVRDDQGRMPLHDAIEDGHEAVLQLLLDRRVEVDVCAAAALDRPDEVLRWLERDPRLVDDRTTGISPLAWASYCDAVNAAGLLIEQGARMDDGELGCAAACGHVRVAEVLVDGGADPNGVVDGAGRTPLHVAAEHRHTADSRAFAAALMGRGADPARVDGAGDRPVDIARRRAGEQAVEGPDGYERNFAGLAMLLEGAFDPQS